MQRFYFQDKFFMFYDKRLNLFKMLGKAQVEICPA